MSSDVPVPSPQEGLEMAKVSQLNGQHLRRLIEAAMSWLKTNQQAVNALNVFPVPDGDTGTNMVLTMQAAYQEIINSRETNIGKMAHAVAQGALMGARGNSGVILSQIWRGFARALDHLDTADPVLFSRALGAARDTAYKGVVRPVEGTILTVMKDVAKSAEAAVAGEPIDFVTLLTRVVESADESVSRTPELLPILKQAGVVDSGGKGLYYIFEGMLRFLTGLSLDVPLTSVQPLAAMQLENSMETIEPGQDFEVVVDFRPSKPLNLDQFYADLEQMGTSIQVGEGDGMYRMHIHVPIDNRYQPIDYTMKLGTITRVSMENLLAQMEDIEKKTSEEKIELTPIEPGQIAVVAVSPGHGFSRIFASLGVAAIVEGGQTMNPSTEQILKAFEDLPTDKVIILPNNKNIYMAAQSAASMSVKKVAVIPTKNAPQGLSSMLRLDHDGDFDRVVEEMTEAMNDVKTGEITIATRTAQINGINVNEGEVIALLNGSLVESCSSLKEACRTLLQKADTEDHERVTLFTGADLTKPVLDEIVEDIRAAYPSHEIEVHYGGQPHYHLIVSIE